MKEVLKKIVTMFLVMMLLINSSAMLIISEAVDEIQILTNNKNVQFIAYFEDDSGNRVSKISKELNSYDMKLYLELSVEKEGYLENANITLKNSNFVFDTQNQIDGISKINDDSLNIDYIGAGESKKIEIKVKAKKDENYNLDLLEQETQIELKANYVNSQSNNTEIATTRKVQWKQTSPYNDENNGAEINQKVITNTNAIYDGQEKRILQLEVENKLNGNEYPVKNTKLELAIPKVNGENPEKVIVNSIQRGLTTKRELTEEDYNYDKVTEKLVINSANEATEENTVEWKQDGEDKYIVTYIFNKVDNIEEQELNAKIELNLYDSKNTKITAENSIELDQEEKNSIISTEILNAEDEIYKGKLYEEKQREITENVKINVNCLKVMANIELQEESNENLETKQISIDKNNMLEILGEEGIIEVLDSNTENKITEINKDTEADENGDIEIKTNDVDAIKIKTSEPQKVGTINIKAIKIIKEEQENKIKQMQEISYAIVGKNINKVETKIKLNETQTDAVLEINKDSLNTMQENEIEAKVILKENSEANDLYKNPTIEIELPEQVEQAEITNINKMYADNFKISEYGIEEKNGGKIIRVKLVGEDTKYVENIIGGPTVVLNLKLTLDKLAKTSTEKIKMTYTNEKSKGYKDNAQIETEEKEIQITSPTGIITTNRIKELDVNTIGEEENKNVKIEVGQEEKQATVEKEVINNTGDKVENVVISGRFATDGKDNNMGIALASTIGVSGIENAKVYYTEKEDATEDLNDSNNGWTTEASINSKNYMIAIDKMEATDVANITYKEKIPSSLEYNKNAVETYAIKYNENSNETSQQVNGTSVKLTTGTGPDLNVTLTAQVGGVDIANGDEVKQGEVIKYIAKVTNNGTEDAENVTVKGVVPDGTVYIEKKNGYKYAGNDYYKENIDTKEFEKTIDILKSGESQNYTYEVKVKENNVIAKNIINIEYNAIVKESNEFNIKLGYGDIILTAKSISDEDGQIIPTWPFTLAIAIDNISENDYINVPIEIVNSENINIQKIEVLKNESDVITKVDGSNEFILDSLPAKTSRYIYVEYKLKDNIDNDIITFSGKLKNDKKIYRSNQYITQGHLYKATISQTSPSEQKEVKYKEELEYHFKIVSENIQYIRFKDKVPNELIVTEVSFNGNVLMSYNPNKEKSDTNKSINNDIDFSEVFDLNKENEIVIKAIVNSSDNKNKKEISNKGVIYTNGTLIAESNEIKSIVNNYVDTNVPTNPDDPSKPDNPDNPNNPDNPSEPDVPVNPDSKEKYDISGIAWIDKDENGQKDDGEEILKDIEVRLYDIKNNEILKDKNNSEIIEKTKEDGKYTFENIPKGKYIAIFTYDTDKYNLTKYKVAGVSEGKTSKVFRTTLNLDGNKREYAVTDIFEITDRGIYTINIGLIKLKELDLKIEKGINKIIIQDGDKTTVNQYDFTKLAKVELNAKKVANTLLVVEYEFKISNVGEADAYVKKVVDSLPKDMQFKAELNSDWYQKDGKLYNTTMANKKIKAGESQKLTLILTKQMTTSNTGLVNNKVEIEEIYNEQNLSEKDKDNNKDNAQLIVSIKTGEFIKYSFITITAISLLMATILLIIKRKDEERR